MSEQPQKIEKPEQEEKQESQEQPEQQEQQAHREKVEYQQKENPKEQFQIESDEENNQVKEIEGQAKDVVAMAAMAGIGGIAEISGVQKVKNAINQMKQAEITKQETKKLVSQAGLERKTEAFEQSRNWEFFRLGQMNQHKQIIDSIWGRIQRNIQTSDDSMKLLIQVFKQRIEQEEVQVKYLTSSSFNKLFKDSDGKIVNSNYPEFSKAIRVVDQMQERQAEGIKLLSLWIQTQIRERLEQEMINFEKQNKDLNSQYNKQRKTALEMEKDVNKYFGKYEKLYLNMTQKHKKQNKDFLYAELKYKQAAYKQLAYLREFGKWLLNAWGDITQLEIQRLDLVTQTIIDLQIQLTTCYGKSVNSDNSIQALKSIQTKIEVQGLYSQVQVLSKQELDYIQNEQQQEVQHYLSDLQVVDKFAELAHPLILKAFSAQRDVGAIGVTWQDIGIYISVDHYFLIFEGKATRYSKPDTKFPLEGLKIMRKNDVQIDVVFVIPGLVIDSKKKLSLQFKRQDDLEELQYYLETIGQNKFEC
ncbi:hypothetical protein pb186bvf_019228 [Paramecium bursaria]